MTLQNARSSAYGEKSTIPTSVGHKPHHTHSAASSGGAAPIGPNPANAIKHPNFCPQCGESLSTGGGPIPPGGVPPELGLSGGIGMPPPSDGLPGADPTLAGLREMTGSPSVGAAAHARRKTKHRTKTKPKPSKGGTTHG
jgi:hypothetical protein